MDIIWHLTCLSSSKNDGFMTFLGFRSKFLEIQVQKSKWWFLKKGHTSDLMEGGKMTVGTYIFIPYASQGGSIFLPIKWFSPGVLGPNRLHSNTLKFCYFSKFNANIFHLFLFVFLPPIPDLVGLSLRYENTFKQIQIQMQIMNVLVIYKHVL